MLKQDIAGSACTYDIYDQNNNRVGTFTSSREPHTMVLRTNSEDRFFTYRESLIPRKGMVSGFFETSVVNLDEDPIG